MEYKTNFEQRAAEYLNQNLLKIHVLVLIFHFKSHLCLHVSHRLWQQAYLKIRNLGPFNICMCTKDVLLGYA